MAKVFKHLTKVMKFRQTWSRYFESFRCKYNNYVSRKMTKLSVERGASEW